MRKAALSSTLPAPAPAGPAGGGLPEIIDARPDKAPRHILVVPDILVGRVGIHLGELPLAAAVIGIDLGTDHRLAKSRLPQFPIMGFHIIEHQHIHDVRQPEGGRQPLFDGRPVVEARQTIGHERQRNRPCGIQRPGFPAHGLRQLIKPLLVLEFDFVSHTPQNHAGMVDVPGDHRLQVPLPPFLEEFLEIQAGGSPFVIQLVNDKKAHLIRQVIEGGRLGIVGAAQGVAASSFSLPKRAATPPAVRPLPPRRPS